MPVIADIREIHKLMTSQGIATLWKQFYTKKIDVPQMIEGVKRNMVEMKQNPYDMDFIYRLEEALKEPACELMLSSGSSLAWWYDSGYIDAVEAEDSWEEDEIEEMANELDAIRRDIIRSVERALALQVVAQESK